MIELLRNTVKDASVFWAAIEALATLGALFLLIKELPKIKREVSAHKVEGLKFAREVITSAEFVAAYDIIRDAWKGRGEEYPSQIDDFIVTAFAKLDLVATLIDEGYVDKRLLLYEFANDLYMLERFTTNFEHRKETKMHGIRGVFPKAYDLLKDAARFAQNETEKAFRRQKRYRKGASDGAQHVAGAPGEHRDPG